MASTLTLEGSDVGKGAKQPVRALGGRPMLIACFKLAMGNPYVVGGESISEIWDYFADVLTITVLQNEVTAADRRDFMVDLTNKKLLQYDAFNTEETATDQTAVADVRLLVFGFAK